MRRDKAVVRCSATCRMRIKRIYRAHNKVVLRELTLDGATQFVDEPVQFHFVYSLGTLGMWNADSDPHEFEYLRMFFRKFSLQSSFIDPCLV